MSGKRNVSVCRGHELANALYVGYNSAIVVTKNELQELYSGYPEVIQIDSTYGY